MGAMTEQMRTVLWIAGLGAVILFAALGALVGLMYLLTSTLFQRAAKTAESVATPILGEAEAYENDRRRRAVALAVAIACGEADSAAVLAPGAPTEWRLLHRASRLRRTDVRRGSRT